MFCPQCGSNNSPDARFCVSCGARFAPTAYSQVDLSSLVTTQPRNAGFWFRVLALFIDTFLCQTASVFLILPMAFALGASMADSATLDEIELAGESLGVVLGIVIQWLWFTIPESSKWQASLGKKLLGLKVTDENGNRIGFGRANGRYWSKILSGLLFGFGFLMVAFTQKKQGLHDKIAGTLVIRANG